MVLCDTGLQAIDQANKRGSEVYTTSGVSACQCRHQMVRPNGVGDLQRGERFAFHLSVFSPQLIEIFRQCNIDYIFWSSIQNHPSPRVVISYDIACAWHVNLLARRRNLPPPLSAGVIPVTLDFVIPKFHIYSHGKSCQDKFSLNFCRGMAWTDGENIECGWAWMNPTSLSTRKMGPGSRCDTLDDQWNYWNWQIVVQLGKYNVSMD